MTERFSTNKLYEASYLEGVQGKKCLRIEDDPVDQARFIFVFDIPRAEGERLVMAFGSSESCLYDSSVKRFKGKLADRRRRARQRQY